MVPKLRQDRARCGHSVQLWWGCFVCLTKDSGHLCRPTSSPSRRQWRRGWSVSSNDHRCRPTPARRKPWPFDELTVHEDGALSPRSKAQYPCWRALRSHPIPEALDPRVLGPRLRLIPSRRPRSGRDRTLQSRTFRRASPPPTLPRHSDPILASQPAPRHASPPAPRHASLPSPPETSALLSFLLCPLYFSYLSHISTILSTSLRPLLSDQLWLNLIFRIF